MRADRTPLPVATGACGRGPWLRSAPMRSGVALFVLLVLALLVAGAHAEHPASKPGAAAVAGPTKAPPARSLAAATRADRRYALANGCYALRAQSGGFVAKALGGYSASAAAGGAEGFRMQATDLGKYLFYGRDRDFMAAGAANLVAPAADASPAADWRVDVSAGDAFTITLPAQDRALGVSPADR